MLPIAPSKVVSGYSENFSVTLNQWANRHSFLLVEDKKKPAEFSLEEFQVLLSIGKDIWLDWFYEEKALGY